MTKTNISAIIIDDDPEAINLLVMYLRIFPFIEIKGTETDAKKGLELAKEFLPDIVFLDIDMPKMNGLQVANKIQNDNFYSEIVFTTAHQQYAYDALGIEPLDFLTKPFCIEDLESVIQKFETKTERKKQAQKLDKFVQSNADSLTIKLPTVEGVLIITIKDIVLLKTNGSKCMIYLQDGSIEKITRHMSLIIDTLNSSLFFQISRRVCINLNYLKYIDKRNLACTLEFNGTQIEESIKKSHLSVFEKLDIFPIIQYK